MTTPAQAAPATITGTYPGHPSQIAAVRARLRELLTACPIADEAILCASELAANAAIHSNSRLPGGTFTIRAALSPGQHVTIEVDDDGGTWTPLPADPWRDHGLDIINAIAAEWTIRGDHHHRTITARINWPQTTAAEAGP